MLHHRPAALLQHVSAMQPAAAKLVLCYCLPNLWLQHPALPEPKACQHIASHKQPPAAVPLQVRGRGQVLFSVRALRVVLPQAGERARGAHARHLPRPQQVSWAHWHCNSWHGGTQLPARISAALLLGVSWQWQGHSTEPWSPHVPPVGCRPETGHWETPFQYCQAVCRTTARSTQHENAFILDRKYCFSKVRGLGRV